jgi:hypothetical protein
MTKPDDVQRDANGDKPELTIDELDAVNGGVLHAQTNSDSTKQSSDSNADRRKSGLDTIQKFLDIVRSMNPQI